MYNISIIVPVYNREKTLHRTIDSILIQKGKFEIILIDDGSSDNSATICDDCAKKYDNIKVIHQDNTGVSVARNSGIEFSQGEYILFVDAGDEIATDTVENLENTILKYNRPDAISYSFLYVYQDRNVKSQYLDKVCVIDNLTFLDWFFKHKFYGGGIWQTIYKRNIIKNIKFDRHLFMGEDQVFLVKALSLCTRIIVLPKCFYYYVIDNKYGYNKEMSAKAILNSLDSGIEICLYLKDRKFYKLASHRLIKSAGYSIISSAKREQPILYCEIRDKITKEILPKYKLCYSLDYWALKALVLLPTNIVKNIAKVVL